jgi:rhamnulokinase
MTHAGWVAAVDLGASSGRVMLGHVGPDTLEIKAVHRFPNQPVRTADGLHWNILELYRNILVGLGKAVAERPELVSVGIDSWAVDYGLVVGDRLVGVPFNYRDDRSAQGVELVHALVTQESLYATGGLQFLPFNTLYQLAVDGAAGLLTSATMLMLPDLFGFWLTGAKVAERTNASTTGLLDLVDGDWNAALSEKLGLPTALVPPVVAPGTRVGRLRDEVAAEVGTDRPLDLVAVGSHDTASAVVAVPMTGRSAAYISSGTWSLVGVELDRPVLSDSTFTNEGGVDGRVRYLRNVMGLWLLSESIRTWERSGEPAGLTELIEEAADIAKTVPVFDANHPSLLPGGDIPARITELCADEGKEPPTTRAEFVRSILESLAAAYATTLDDAERLSGITIDTVHVVGGGSQNALLCQLTADRSGRRVLAGPVEATAIGNVLVQARVAGFVTGGLEDLRALVARTFPPTEYLPGPRSGEG